MSNKFWDKHSIKGTEKSSGAHQHVYGDALDNAELSDPSTMPSKTAKPTSDTIYGGGHNDDRSHPGFAAVQKKVQGEGYSKEAAGAIVANAARKASPAAKKANPNLKKVKG